LAPLASCHGDAVEGQVDVEVTAPVRGQRSQLRRAAAPGRAAASEVEQDAGGQPAGGCPQSLVGGDSELCQQLQRGTGIRAQGRIEGSLVQLANLGRDVRELLVPAGEVCAGDGTRAALGRPG